MPYTPNQAHLTPDQRRHEIAVILAKGILRLRRSAQCAQESAEYAPSTMPQKGLDVSGTSRPHVTRG